MRKLCLLPSNLSELVAECKRKNPPMCGGGMFMDAKHDSDLQNAFLQQIPSLASTVINMSEVLWVSPRFGSRFQLPFLGSQQVKPRISDRRSKSLENLRRIALCYISFRYAHNNAGQNQGRSEAVAGVRLGVVGMAAHHASGAICRFFTIEGELRQCR